MRDIITLALKPKLNALVEFHPTQVGATMYPFRAGNLVAFWRTKEEASKELAGSPIIMPLMEIFDVEFVEMSTVHDAVKGKPMAAINMSAEPPHFPFDLVYVVSEQAGQALPAANAQAEREQAEYAERTGQQPALSSAERARRAAANLPTARHNQPRR